MSTMPILHHTFPGSGAARLAALTALLWLAAFFAAGQAHAAPLTTKYYSITPPPDWVVVDGPSMSKGVVQVLLGQKDHKASAFIIVGPARPGEGEEAARGNARRLGGSEPAARNGQWEFTFEQQGVRGYGVVREDASSGLLLLLLVSGEVSRAEFIYQMRGPYKALVPVKPRQQ